MRTRWLALLVLTALLLSGCSHMAHNPFMGHADIDWVDFVKLGKDSYTSEYETVLADPALVTDEVVGTVKFKVADVVTNPNYRTKPGDAAFLPKGTKLFRIQGYAPDEAIAAEDKTHIGGYRVYVEDGQRDRLSLSYMRLPKDSIERVALFDSQETEPYRTLIGDEKNAFIRLLDSGTDVSGYSPVNRSGDGFSRMMVFYTDSPFALGCFLFDDGTQVYFSPDGIRLIDDDIRELIAR
ncbi:hypothetical protein [Cohnella sp. 56]|uniref:hypothetical protein n=1 Tax=Cohnella sp. 56 TaxID=3113722 RepID=UPI0030E9663D